MWRAVLGLLCLVGTAAGRPVLTRVEQIRQLTVEQAAQGYPVRIQALVTYYAPPHADPQEPGGYTDPGLFVQDSTAGIWVTLPRSAPDLRAGQILALEGVTEAPDFAPQIGHPRYRILGEGPLPPPRRVSFESMLSTIDDGQWVEIDGIVRRTGQMLGLLVLDVAVAGGRLRVIIPQVEMGRVSRLVDAEVRLRGVCGAMFNSNYQMIGVVLYVPSLGQLEIRRAAPADPFAAAPEPIAALQRFAPGRELGHRVKLQGVVSLRDGEQAVYISDGQTGVRIESSTPVRFAAGDRLDVVGFPRVSGFGLVIEDASCRRTGKAALVTPRPVTAQQILDGDYDSLPVSIEARVLERSHSSGMPALALESGAILFEAAMPWQKMENLPPSGARVHLEGICMATNRNDSGQTRAFRLLIGSAAGLRVTRYPSWWTPARALGALSVLSLVVLLAGAWVVSLRRRVHSQVALIRQRLEREAALEQRFHSLLDSAHDMIFTVNPEGMLTSINRAGERVSGYTQEQLADTPLAALFEAESSVVEEAIRSAALEGSYWTADWAVVHKDQRRTQVEVTLQAIREGGQPAGILGISRDISDRKQAEQALLRARQLAGARDAAEQASRAKSAFLANMSHEIRTPLNAIMGYSQMLQEDCVRPEQQEMRADLRKIERAGQILLSLINDILDLSKIEAGRETVKPQNVDVAMVLEDVRNAVAPLAHERGNLLEIDCPAHARVVYADLAKFRQSLLNLVNNACKFTENGRVSIAVDRLRDSNGEWTEVHVSDTGIGIAPENLGKLFQPFSQVEGALTRKCNGTGLGLAISRKFCRLMAGDITVSSEVGRGSRFSIRLPAGKRESVREETEVLSVHDSVGRR